MRGSPYSICGSSPEDFGRETMSPPRAEGDHAPYFQCSPKRSEKKVKKRKKRKIRYRPAIFQPATRPANPPEVILENHSPISPPHHSTASHYHSTSILMGPKAHNIGSANVCQRVCEEGDRAEDGLVFCLFVGGSEFHHYDCWRVGS